MSSKIKYMFLTAICVALASQFQINFFVQGFIITLSVIIFPLFLYFYSELNPLFTAMLTALVSPLFRGIVLYSENRNLIITETLVWPDICFYLAYGIFYYFLYYKRKIKNLNIFALTVFMCDFLSNIVEMSFRTRVTGLDLNIIKGLAVIAVVRTIIVMAVIICSKYYSRFLSREEHEARYRKLILMTARFKSEIYFMHKNMAEIEDVMKKSYTVYKVMSENDYPEEVKNMALGITKDVHEIKKEYIRAVIGLEEMSKDELDIEAMSILDLIMILESDTKEYIRHAQLDISCSFIVERNFIVGLHFYMMSVLKNIVNNSIEALGTQKNGKIKVVVKKKMNEYIISISDNGPGIKEGNLDYIFNPGFSTKFNKDTGNIGRGIGLSLVKDLVEKELNGKLLVESLEGKGTSFSIALPVNTIGKGKERQFTNVILEEEA